MLDWYELILSFAIRRVFALGCIGVGGVLGLLNLQYLVPGATIEVNGEPTGDIVIRLLSVIFPVFATLFGIFLFRLRKLPFSRGSHG